MGGGRRHAGGYGGAREDGRWTTGGTRRRARLSGRGRHGGDERGERGRDGRLGHAVGQLAVAVEAEAPGRLVAAVKADRVAGDGGGGKEGCGGGVDGRGG